MRKTYQWEKNKPNLPFNPMTIEVWPTHQVFSKSTAFSFGPSAVVVVNFVVVDIVLTAVVVTIGFDCPAICTDNPTTNPSVATNRKVKSIHRFFIIDVTEKRSVSWSDLECVKSWLCTLTGLNIPDDLDAISLYDGGNALTFYYI